MTNQSRRAFLKQVSALSMAGVATPFALNLAALSQASASTASDYKAIVCVFLYGGNDNANTVVPYDTTSYNAYQAARSNLAYTQAQLSSTVLNPIAAPIDRNSVAHQYALAPQLAPLLPIFNAGKMGVILNVGTLIQPTTKLQYNNKSVPLPPKLFSHNDQQSVWQSLAPEGARSGWGGRMGDLFLSGNGNTTFTCMNVSGNAVFLSGQTAIQYQVSTAGAVPLVGVKQPLFGSSACSAALNNLVSQPRTHLLENEINRISKRALDAGDIFTAALQSAPNINTVYPTQNSLASQLKLVARTIATADQINVKRQVFFVSMGGFDTHDSLNTTHPALLTKLADALKAFYDTTVELGIANKVTTFTASDFGRTLTSNNDGSDHGWGSMHFVLGGAVNGKRYYGTAPIVASDGPDDVGQGRLLPTISVDQYAATLGKWLGVSDSNLLAILPNLGNFSVGVRNLGFV